MLGQAVLIAVSYSLVQFREVLLVGGCCRHCVHSMNRNHCHWHLKFCWSASLLSPSLRSLC